MTNFLKLKAIAILVCGGFAGHAMADTTATVKTTTTNKMTTTTNGMATTPAVKLNDAAVTSNVKAALADYAGKVTLSVKAGVVELAGELPSDIDYDKVITAAESAKGVNDVNVDKLTVKDSSAPLHDTYITAKVKGALIRADLMGKDIPSWSIRVETKDGQVYLSGNIATLQEKQTILDVVKAVKGVNKVNDKIEIAAPTTAPAATGAAPATTDKTAAAATDDDDEDNASDDEDSAEE